jgi:hypothetical protein
MNPNFYTYSIIKTTFLMQNKNYFLLGSNKYNFFKFNTKNIIQKSMSYFIKKDIRIIKDDSFIIKYWDYSDDSRF